MKYQFKKFRMFVFNKLVPAWVMFLDYIRKITMLLTFILMVVGVCAVAYHTFICYSFTRAVTDCFVLLTLVFVNQKLQG